jgi:hypothetical protein
MTMRPIKIGIAGTHSTGKSTFLTLIDQCLKEHDIATARIDDLATRAKTLGFPILTEHTYESTLWIMADGLRQEAEASLSKDVILIDRPIFDALGYFEAALEVSGRRADGRRLDELRTIARVHTADYDLLILTTLDPSIPLGPARDQNKEFREATARHIAVLASDMAPSALKLTSTNAPAVGEQVVNFILTRRAASKP